MQLCVRGRQPHCARTAPIRRHPVSEYHEVDPLELGRQRHQAGLQADVRPTATRRQADP